ncbi:MFS transporter, partial [Hansschlegelia beijingensis]
PHPIETLLTWVKSGEIAIPEIQRPFVWDATKVRRLLLGGLLADRIGRTATAAGMMAVSGTCALLIGVVFDGPVWLFAIVALIWGVSVVGDSAQFSAMATEVSDPRYVGTALAVQLGVGFALTILSIRLVPVFVDWVGWRWSFMLLTPGPVIGVAAMLALRRRPEAGKIAQGLR